MKTQIKPCKKIQVSNNDLLCLYQYQYEKYPINYSQLTSKLQKHLQSSSDRFEYKAKKYQIHQTESDNLRLLVIGLGPKKSVNNDLWITATYKMLEQANTLRAKNVALIIENSFLRQSLEGINFASYRFDGLFQKQDRDKLSSLSRVDLCTDHPQVNSMIKEQSAVFEAVALARDLVNLPANIVTPKYLEKEASKIANQPGVSLKVIDLKQAEKLKMGAFAAVARGSREPARMLILEYKGAAKSKEKIGIVGKAITFDSGGISLKPPKGMGEMKTDMGGGAAALATFKAVVSLGLKVNLMVAIPATENMPGGNAYKPGDILTASNGKTIEVVSTDAEGRLVMSDALVYLQKQGADKLIDIATLTGACIVTFGHIHTALMTNASDWKDSLLKASAHTGEKFWELPMDQEYGELIESDICDMVNAVESREAGTITAGKLLEQFIEEDSKWLHLDIAGTAFHTKKQKYYGKYATGIPIRTLIELIKGEQNK